MLSGFLRVATLLAVAAACGGGGRAAIDRDERVEDPCRSGTQVRACLEQQRAACDAGQVTRLAYDTLPPITVGPRVLRLDHLGGRLLGSDATRWLACFESCPDGGGERVCFPLSLPLRLSWSAAAGCQRDDREGAPWNGVASRVLALDCPEGPAEIRYLPSLERVASELVRTHAIEAEDVLARIEGVPVEMRAGDTVHSRLLAADAAGCDAFDLPAGYHVVGDAQTFTELERVSSEHAAILAAEVEKVRGQVAITAVKRAKADLLPRFRISHGDACRALGRDPEIDADLEACAAQLPETEVPFRAAVGRETARLLAERRAELDELTRRLLVAPMCRHYAAQIAD